MTEPEPTLRPRDAILDAASAVFAETGFAGARVDEIARRAGVNKAMLYYHVGDKTALYHAVLERNFSRVNSVLTSVVEQAETPTEQLNALIAGLADLVRQYPEHPRIVLREVAAGAPNLPLEIVQQMLGIVATVRSILGRGVASGEFRRTDPVLTHLTIVGAVVFMTAITPLRERIASLDPTVTLPEISDLPTFLPDLLLNGIAQGDQ
jgi:AcrR family transcriptional regulator